MICEEFLNQYFLYKAQNLEGQYFLKGNKLTNVSIEQIVECDGMKDNSTGEADCGVYGGWPFLALQYVKNAVSTQ